MRCVASYGSAGGAGAGRPRGPVVENRSRTGASGSDIGEGAAASGGGAFALQSQRQAREERFTRYWRKTTPFS